MRQKVDVRGLETSRQMQKIIGRKEEVKKLGACLLLKSRVSCIKTSDTTNIFFETFGVTLNL